MNTQEIILTPQEVAPMLKISVSAAYKYASTGVLPAFKIAGNVRFLKSKVMERIEALSKSAYGGSR